MILLEILWAGQMEVYMDWIKTERMGQAAREESIKHSTPPSGRVVEDQNLNHEPVGCGSSRALLTILSIPPCSPFQNLYLDHSSRFLTLILLQT